MYQNLEQFVEETLLGFKSRNPLIDPSTLFHIEQSLRQCAELTAQVIEDAERKQIVGLPESIKIKSLITATTANWLNKE